MAVTVASAVVALVLSACGSKPAPTTSSAAGADTTAAAVSSAPGGQVVAPVIVELASVGGTTVSVPLGNVVVLDTDNPVGWVATIADPTVVSFADGRNDASATFNPGLTPLAAGTTEVSLTNGTTTVAFTLVVTA
jgi:hypothetical protein